MQYYRVGGTAEGPASSSPQSPFRKNIDQQMVSAYIPSHAQIASHNAQIFIAMHHEKVSHHHETYSHVGGAGGGKSSHGGSENEATHHRYECA